MIFFRQGKFYFFDKTSPYHTGLLRLGVSNDGKTQQVEDGLEGWVSGAQLFPDLPCLMCHSSFGFERRHSALVNPKVK